MTVRGLDYTLWSDVGSSSWIMAKVTKTPAGGVQFQEESAGHIAVFDSPTEFAQDALSVLKGSFHKLSPIGKWAELSELSGGDSTLAGSYDGTPVTWTLSASSAALVATEDGGSATITMNGAQAIARALEVAAQDSDAWLQIRRSGTPIP